MPSRSLCVLLSSASLLGGCPSSTEPVDEDLSWYSTCGDPVCSGYSGPFDGVDPCTTEIEGDLCSEEAAQCDFESDCNALLLCAAEDPKAQPGGCPISRRRHKRDIHYLDDAERQRAANLLLEMRLASWQYNWEGTDSHQHLGFIIDDLPKSPAVSSDGERVDLYGYTSLTVAALQAQQAQIESLRAEIAELRAQSLSEPCPQPP